MNSIRSATTTLSRVELERSQQEEEHQKEIEETIRFVSNTTNKHKSERGLQVSQKVSVMPSIDTFPWSIRAMQPTGESTIATNQPTN